MNIRVRIFKQQFPFRLALPYWKKRYVVICISGFLLAALVFIVMSYLLQREGAKGQSSVGITHKVSPGILDSPLTLHIPKLNIRTTVEPVGLDKEGNMAVPQDTKHVSWYEKGAQPGEAGSMVFAGHVDDQKGKPAVFAKLNSLIEGDTIIVNNMAKKSFTYVVMKKETYSYDDAPLEDIFGPSDESHLNLITCAGAWDEKTKNYPQREVVYAKLRK